MPDALFTCTQCPKTFTRADYLARHALNHSAKDITCPLCGRHFNRLDVLRKHLGGPCKAAADGILKGSTSRADALARIDAVIPRKRKRKRASRADGLAQASDTLSPELGDDEQGDAEAEMGEVMARTQAQTQTQSEPAVERHETFGQGGMHDSGYDSSTARFMQGEHTVELGMGTTTVVPDANISPILPYRSSMLDTLGGPYMGESPAPAPAGAGSGTGSGIGSGLVFGQGVAHVGAGSMIDNPVDACADGAERDLASAPGAALRGSGDGMDAGWTTANQSDNMDDLFRWLFQSPGEGWMGVDTIPASAAAPGTGEGAALATETGPLRMNTDVDHHSPDRMTAMDMASRIAQPTLDAHAVPRRITAALQVQAQASVQAHAGPSTADPRRPLPFHPFAVPNQPPDLPLPSFSPDWYENGWSMPPPNPLIDNNVRAEMLDLLENDAQDAAAVFSVERMVLYLDLYFINFAPLYPLIHRASLPYRKPAPDLLLAMVCIGTAFAANKQAFGIATQIHKRIRKRVFERVEDEPRIDVVNLQTLLLINHFSRSYCSLKQHDTSQIFHSPSIMMARLAGVFQPVYRSHVPPNRDPLDCWLSWVAQEERKRLGWFTFEMDTLNAACFRHTLLTHCFDVEIPLPSSSASFSAPDPTTWQVALAQAPALPSFRNTLRDLTSRGHISDALDSQCLWILLHGLISVSWTLLWRDLGDLSMVHESKITQWKESLRRAFTIWETCVDDMLARERAGRGMHGGHGGHRGLGEAVGRNARDEWGADYDLEYLGSTGRPFAHLGCVLLLTDTEQIRIFAGASNVTGRPVSRGEWAAANAYVTAWAQSQDSAYACQAAMKLLAQVFESSHEWRFAQAPVPIVWGLYISALVIWAYAAVTEGQVDLVAPYVICVVNVADERVHRHSLAIDAILDPHASSDHDHAHAPPPHAHAQMHVPRCRIEIEPTLARRDALRYLARFGPEAISHPFDLASMSGLNACVGIVAYAAHLLGGLGRGITDESAKVLEGLLTEHM